MPLRIPSGWAVVFNKFVELPPPAEVTPEDRDAYLSQDILSMMKTAYSGEGWRTQANSLIIDLGWYVPAGSDGFYRLCVLRGSWDDVLITVEDADQYVVRDRIDLILERLSNGVPIDDVVAEVTRLSDGQS
ncbi:hypothetical protein ACFYZB_00480 [Streptomyces sp. NPDC001852]|uniref:hypothetical protein n=1 Tax=Streptomyces sp. NPDC001852 TaxID=3364619 RepID=UPI0036AC9560